MNVLSSKKYSTSSSKQKYVAITWHECSSWIGEAPTVAPLFYFFSHLNLITETHEQGRG